MNINKIKCSPFEQAEREYADALAAKNAANIDYIAMMCDVDIPTEEVEINVSED